MHVHVEEEDVYLFTNELVKQNGARRREKPNQGWFSLERVALLR